MRALSQPMEATAPVVTVEVDGYTLPPSTRPQTSRSTAPWTRAILILVAIGIGALALTINGQFGWHFGTTPMAAITFAGLAVAADLLAMVLPGAAVALWHAGRSVLAVAAWLTWPLATALAMLASLGFVELNVGDTAAGRQALVTTAAAITDQRSATIAAAQLALTTATKQREAECLKRGPLCRDREADERTALATLNTAVATPVPTVATIAEADPQVTGALRLATWAGLGVKSDDVKNVRLALMAILPNIAGLLFAFAVGLGRPQRR